MVTEWESPALHPHTIIQSDIERYVATADMYEGLQEPAKKELFELQYEEARNLNKIFDLRKANDWLVDKLDKAWRYDEASK